MSIQEQNKELDELLDIVNPSGMTLITGGKGGGKSNWLKDLRPGTCFVCRAPQGDASKINPFLQEFHVIATDGNTVKLLNNLNEVMYTWVDSTLFCRIFDLVTVVGEVVYDGTSDGTIQSREVEDNATVETGPLLDDSQRP